jgi:hypothetical protein
VEHGNLITHVGAFPLGEEGLRIVGKGARVLFRESAHDQNEPYREAIYGGIIFPETLSPLSLPEELESRILGKCSVKFVIRDEAFEKPLMYLHIFDGNFAVEASTLYWSRTKTISGERLREYLHAKR